MRLNFHKHHPYIIIAVSPQSLAPAEAGEHLLRQQQIQAQVEFLQESDELPHRPPLAT